MVTSTRRPDVSRRDLLKAGGASLLVMQIMPGRPRSPGKAWAAKPQALKPETMATLVQMARDIYPHDQVADRYYAIAVKGLDQAAANDPALQATDRERHRRASTRLRRRRKRRLHRACGWEGERVALLKADRDHAVLPDGARRARHRPLQPEGGLADLRLRGRVRLQGRLHRARLQRHRLALTR